MYKVLTIVVLAISAIGSANAANSAADPGIQSGSRASSLQRKSSFASMLLDPLSGKAISDAIGSECADFLRKIYRSGHTLASTTLAAAAKPVKDVEYLSGVEDNTFFQYTKANPFFDSLHPEITDRNQANKRAIQEGAYDQEFLFLRSRAGGLNNKVLYVAEDPASSSNFGSHEIEFDFDPNAKILDQNSVAWVATLKELSAKYPGLSTSCPTDGLSSGLPTDIAYDSQIYLIIADDSGIDLINYTRNKWFKVLSFKNLIATHVIK